MTYYSVTNLIQKPDPQRLTLKQQLHALCMTHIRRRITGAEEAIHAAQFSANEETKSSAGDKYETGRAMAQLEIEKNSIQLSEAKKLLNALEQINPAKLTSSIQSGSLVKTNAGWFYVAVSAGQLNLLDKTYFAISPASPVGQKLMGLRPKDSYVFNGKKIIIEEVY